ncbi:hypothetical protein WJX74_008471 [Apatococcus lobatus]|uniref:Uncharacterized protein n=1 Tax=Apatococcus lobatus TaxID=904363 RepID=A0AAW1QYW3_9CHLO
MQQERCVKGYRSPVCALVRQQAGGEAQHEGAFSTVDRHTPDRQPRLDDAFLKVSLLVKGKRFKSTMADFADDLETVNEKFVEARDEIEYAQEDAETLYFNESHSTAKQAVTACLDLFSSISNQLDEAERGKLQRSMGMKMEQLKEELAQLDTLHD